MKLFLLFIVSILFVACSSKSPDNQQPEDSAPIIPTTVEDAPIPEDMNSADSDLVNIHTETDLTPTSEIAETPSNEQGLIPLDQLMTPAPVLSPTDEEILPLESTEDQRLIVKIKTRYQDYINLHHTWEEHSPQMEELLQQVTDPEFIEPILFVQSHIADAPVTESLIAEIEEQLSDEAVFIYSEDREEAKETYEYLDKYVDLLDKSMQLSLQYAQLAEKNPDIIYAQTTEEEIDEPKTLEETAIAEAETPTTTTQPDVSDATATDDNINVIKKLYDELIASVTSTPEATTEPTATVVPVETAPVVVAIESNEVVVDENETDDDGDDNSTQEAVAATEEIIETKEDTNTATTTEEAADNSTQEAIADIEEVTDNSTSIQEDVAATEVEESWTDFFTETIPSVFTETIPSLWNELTTPNPSWILEPTSLHIPNTDNIVTEEMEVEMKQESQEEAQQLIDRLLQNAEIFVQTHDISSLEDLTLYMENILNIPAEEITNEQVEVVNSIQVSLINPISQIVQNINEQEDISGIADFVELSDYKSESLSQEEIVIVIEMLSKFANS